MAAHHPQVGPRLGAESVQTLLPVGADPAVQGGTGIHPGAPIWVGVAYGGQLADELTPLGGAQALAQGIGNDVVAEQGDGFGGIGTHGRLLGKSARTLARSPPAG